MDLNEKTAWQGMAVLSWVIGIFRYVFGAGTLAARIEALEAKTQSMHDRLDGIANGQVNMVQDIGVIKGQLLRIGRK
jgi:hypothetical protein